MKIPDCSEVSSRLFYNDQMKGQQDTSLIKVTRLFNKTLS